jgi:hypothetical protein
MRKSCTAVKWMFAIVVIFAPIKLVALEETEEEALIEETPGEAMPEATEDDFKGTETISGDDAVCSSEEDSVALCDESADIVDEWSTEFVEGALLDGQSVPCSPGSVYWDCRVALGRLLDNTPADLDGTDDRESWFRTFPQTQVFPMGMEVSGIKWRYNPMGTVGLVAPGWAPDGP